MAFVIRNQVASRPHGSLPSRADDLLSLVTSDSDPAGEVNIGSLARRLGIDVQLEPMTDDISGYLERRGQAWVIGVNSLHHPRRQRFTIAHELAHFVLHRTARDSFTDKTLLLRSSSKDPMESEADRFAAELLMPRDRFLKAVESGCNTIEQLASEFNTSMMAVKLRARELNMDVQ